MVADNKTTNIKIRIDKEKKEAFKKVIDNNNSSMTEVIIKFIDNYIQEQKEKEYKIKCEKIQEQQQIKIESRIKETDIKLLELKNRMGQQHQHKKKKLFKIF